MLYKYILYVIYNHRNIFEENLLYNILLEFYQYKMQSLGFDGRPFCWVNASYISLWYSSSFFKDFTIIRLFSVTYMEFGTMILPVCLSAYPSTGLSLSLLLSIYSFHNKLIHY